MQSYSFPTVIIPIVDLDGSTTGTVKPTDIYPAVDVTDVTQSPQGTTKHYQIVQLLDFLLSSLGLTTYAPVQAASTVTLTATYNNGLSGVGATLTNAGSFVAFSLDGQTGILNARYLIKNQTSAFQNGIYTLTTVGDAVSVNWVLTRATDFNSSANIVSGALVYVLYGTSNGSTIWQDTFTAPIIVGTTAINYALWNSTIGINGMVNSGTVNDLGYYAANGNVISPLPTGNNGVLITSNTGIPSISSTLPTDLIITSPQINTIDGQNLNLPVLGFDNNTNSVNYFEMFSAAAGQSPTLSAVGADTNIDISILGKGTGGIALHGYTDGTSAAAGYVGELISSVVLVASAVSLTNNTAKNVTSISLTAGDWDIEGNIYFTIGGSCTGVEGSASLATNTIATDAAFFNEVSATAITNTGISIPFFPLQISSTTTVYLVAQASFTTSTVTACGGIYARRRR